MIRISQKGIHRVLILGKDFIPKIKRIEKIIVIVIFITGFPAAKLIGKVLEIGSVKKSKKTTINNT